MKQIIKSDTKTKTGIGEIKRFWILFYFLINTRVLLN